MFFEVTPSSSAVDHGVQGPLHDQHPVVVALPHHRRQRLLGNDVRQDDVVTGLRQVEPQRIKLGHVGRQRVALAGIIGFENLIQLAELHLLVLDIVGVEIVGEVEFGRGAALHAHLAVVRSSAESIFRAAGIMNPSPS